MFQFRQCLLILFFTALAAVGTSEASERHRDVTTRSDAKSSSSSKIFFGSDTKRNKYPFVMYMRIGENNWWCSASLINSKWGLTAAHCTGKATEVVLGDYIRPEVDGSEQVIPIEEEINHPDYYRPDFEHDIALIKLAYPANLSSDAVATIAPLKSKKYMKQMLDNKKSCRVLGWGDRYEGNVHYDYSNRLQETRMEFVNASYPSAADVYRTAGMMPVTAVYTDKCGRNRGGPCAGDSGAPLVCKRKGKWVQTGVYSFFYLVDGCMRWTKGVANVQQHYSWIESIIGQ